MEKARVKTDVETIERFTIKPDIQKNEKIMIYIMLISELYKKSCTSIFRNYGITFSQHTVMRILDRSVDGQNTVTRVSKAMLVSGVNITGISKRLEKSGFIIRRSDPQDERVTILEITPKGRQTLKYISSERDKIIDELLADYSDQKRDELLYDLRKCLKRAKDYQNL